MSYDQYWTKSGYPGALGGGEGEWLCPHGIGHGNHTHGCDGCCQREDYPGLKRKNHGEGRLEETEEQQSNKGAV